MAKQHRCTINDNDREDWVNNDEGLYNWWQRSGVGITTFVRRHRQEIDIIIRATTEGTIPSHFLAYGPR